MNNVKLAFERYLDVKTIQKRQSLLKWSLETSNTTQFTPLYTRCNDGENWGSIGSKIIEKSSIFKLSSLLHKDIRDLKSVKSHVNQFARSLSSTDTRFFENNFDIIVNESSSISEQGELQLQLMKGDLQLFSGEREDYTPDVIEKVNALFHWLYENKLYSLAYQLVVHVLNNLDVFFKQNELSHIINVIDHSGTVDDFLLMSELYKTTPIPSILKRSQRLGNSTTLIKLSELKTSLDTSDFVKSIEIIDLLLHIETSNLNGLKFLIYKLIDQAIPTISKSKEMVNYILNISNKAFFSPRTVIFIYTKGEFKTVNHQIQFFITFIKLHSNDEYFEFEIYKLLKSMKKTTLAFGIWYENNFRHQSILNLKPIVDESYPKLEKLHQENLDNLPKQFVRELQLNKDTHSDVLSLLIFTHSQYGKDYSKVKSYYSQKKQFEYKISETDKICHISSLINSKDYDNILSNYEQVLQLAVESPKLMDDLMVGFARSQKWKEMEQLYIKRFLHNDEISIHQYSALFISLSMRSGSTKFILKLWETFLKAGHSPTDHILCCIIISFIKSKAYREALQWFSAYPKYKISLSARSYSLMINILASTRDSSTVFQLIDTLLEQNKNKLKGKFMGSILKQFASIGDYKSIERLILEYYPKFHIKITDKDTRWILKSHYFSNRFSVILKQFWRMEDSELDYDMVLLALETSIKLKSTNEFRSIWERIYPIFSKSGELDPRAFSQFMAYWVRVYGLFGSENKLKEIKSTLSLNSLPMSVYNQMIFSSIRSKKPWLVSKIVQMATNDGCILTPKTYSLILYSYVSMPWIGEKSVEKCIKITNEILNTKKNDKFGMIDQDINPIALKMVIKLIIKQNDIYEARRLFELYLETSTNNLLDNIHILNIELMLLGEEERWVEFDQCYKKYIEILERYMIEAKMIGSSHNMGKTSIQRSEKLNFHELNIEFDEKKIKQNNMNSKIPNWLKHAHFDIWQYRLKQLDITESLSNINQIFSSLIEKQILISNKNLNETALLLSSKSGLFDETIEFINKYILPWHIRAKSYDRMRLMHGWGISPLIGVSKPIYHFIPEVYFKVIKNLNITLNDVMTGEQKGIFLNNVNSSFEYNILKNLPIIESTSREGKIRKSQFDTRRGSFYRNKRRVNKLYNRWNMKYQNAWIEIEESQKYKEREFEMKEQMNKLGSKLVHMIFDGRPRFEVEEVKSVRDEVKKEYLKMIRDQRSQRKTLIKKQREMEGEESLKD